MSGLSPYSEFTFFAARARSTDISASAQSGVPQRGCKLGHPNVAQRGLSGQLTGRGDTVEEVDVLAVSMLSEKRAIAVSF